MRILEEEYQNFICLHISCTLQRCILPTNLSYMGEMTYKNRKTYRNMIKKSYRRENQKLGGVFVAKKGDAM